MDRRPLLKIELKTIDSTGFLAACYASQHAVAVVLATACKSYANMTNSFAGSQVDAPFQP